MKVIVGLGNPGKKYEGTRHNIGYDVLSVFASRHGVQRVQNRFKAEVANVQIGDQSVLLVSPLTYMNLSGRSVRGIVDFYKLNLGDLMVISDDLALELGRLRIRASGSAGGQKGIANIIEQLGTDQFSRLRVGIGQPNGNTPASTFVLQQFSKKEREEIEIACQRGADALELWVTDGVSAAMNKFNADLKKEPNERKNVGKEPVERQSETKLNQNQPVKPSSKTKEV